MFRKHNSTRNLVHVSLLMIVLLFQVGWHCSLEVKAGGGIVLRSPFNGTYRLTS